MTDALTTVASKFEPVLRVAGLLDLDGLFARDDFETVKALLDVRQTFRTRTADGTVFYIKRYTNPEPDSFWAGLGARRFTSQAAREYHVLARLADLGVPAPTPAACIEETSGGRVTRAAVITLGLPAEISLQQVVEDQALPHARRARFALELGRVLRAMHEGGVNHRDFYFVHIRVGADDTLYVTDLNRADIRRHVTRRWRVKDLAALLYSAPAAVTATDKARFARAYFGGRMRDHRGIIAAVLRKAERIRAHTRKRVAQGQPNYHVTE